MADRIKGFVVSLTEDMHEEDAEHLRKAILMLRNVQAVAPSVSDPDDWMNRERVRAEMGRKLLDVVYPKPAGDR